MPTLLLPTATRRPTWSLTSIEAFEAKARRVLKKKLGRLPTDEEVAKKAADLRMRKEEKDAAGGDFDAITAAITSVAPKRAAAELRRATQRRTEPSVAMDHVTVVVNNAAFDPGAVGSGGSGGGGGSASLEPHHGLSARDTGLGAAQLKQEQEQARRRKGIQRVWAGCQNRSPPGAGSSVGSSGRS